MTYREKPKRKLSHTEQFINSDKQENKRKNKEGINQTLQLISANLDKQVLLTVVFS